MKTYAGKNTLNKLKVKLLKNIGLLYEAKPYIDKHSLLSLYHSYIHAYINYGNIAWGSTTRKNLLKIYSQQTHAIQIIYSENRLSHTKELFTECKILTVYQVNIWKN